MNKVLTFLVILILVLPAGAPSSALASGDTVIVPTFSIVSVLTDTSVTIQAYNFPQNKSFDVLMGPMGTRGVNGIKAATINSGSGGAFTATFPIPAALAGSYQIAIRLENDSSGYYAYNWFYNNTSGVPLPGPNPYPVPVTIPTFFITGVVQDSTVSIQTNNFPSNDSFDVLMGPMGTRGVNGIKVGTVSSGSGGTLSFTFNIPSALYGSYQIAIRLQANTGSGYYAYNWFYNNTSGGSPGTGGGYSGYPTFSISSVVRNESVTIVTYNLPPDDTFNVLMGPMGTRGIGGILVQTIDSGSGGSQTLTFAIPDALKGSNQIAIRLESITGSGLYAYNWFYNNTTN